MELSAMFKKISRQFDIEFGELSKEISHHPISGEARENVLRRFLTKYLSQRVGIEQGFVIDAQGQESKQIDVVIYDKTVATAFDVNGVKYFTCEIVLAVGEVKSDINCRRDLEDALNKIKSVKELDRSNQGKNLIITGPGISLTGLKFDPLTQHRDQILGFIFTRTSMTKETILEALQEYNSKVDVDYGQTSFLLTKISSSHMKMMRKVLHHQRWMPIECIALLKTKFQTCYYYLFPFYQHLLMRPILRESTTLSMQVLQQQCIQTILLQ